MQTSLIYSQNLTYCSQDNSFGHVNIQLNSIEKGLFVKIETKRLLILSVNTNKYESQFIALYGDKEVNKLVGTGTTLSPNLVRQKVQRWINRWSAFNPFSGYVILEQNTGDFVGQIILKPVKNKSEEKISFLPGVAEIGYLSMKKYWGKGYGKEFTHAVINHLIPCLIREKFQVNGKSITTLIATTDPNNIASNRILNIFMRFYQEKERYGSTRMWYRRIYKKSLD